MKISQTIKSKGTVDNCRNCILDVKVFQKQRAIQLKESRLKEFFSADSTGLTYEQLTEIEKIIFK